MKKVLHLINNMEMAGAEILVANSLAPGGLQDHVDNYLVYLQGTTEILDRIDKNVKIFCLNYKGLYDLPRMLFALRKIIVKNKIDIIHSHLTPSSFYANLVRPKRIPQVHTLHSNYSKDRTARRYMLFLEKHLFYQKPYCNMIFVSDYTRNDFLQYVSFKGKSFIVGNFVDDKYFSDKVNFYPPTSTHLKLVAAGGLRNEKNYEYLFEVLSHCRSFNISLDIFGDGDFAKYQQMIDEQRINVRLMGVNNDLSVVLNQYDLFILPSKFESFSLSTFEAMASGVPVMLSDIASLQSVVKDHAIYFPLNNAAKTANILIDILNKKIDINSQVVKAKEYTNSTVRRPLYISKLTDIYKKLYRAV